MKNQNTTFCVVKKTAFRALFVPTFLAFAFQTLGGSSAPKPAATVEQIPIIIAHNPSGATNMTVSPYDTDWYSFEVPSVPPVSATAGHYVTMVHMYSQAWVTETRWEPGTKAKKGQYRCRLYVAPVSASEGGIWISIYSQEGAVYRRRFSKKVDSNGANIKFSGKADTTYYMSITPASQETATYSATFSMQVLPGGKPSQ